MPQEDKIKREIDRIGLVLAKLLSIVLHKPFEHGDKADIVAENLQSGLDISIPDFLKLYGDAAINYLTGKKFSLEHMRQFADLLYSLANNAPGTENSDVLRASALNIYKYISQHGSTLFLDVEMKLKELSKKDH